MSDFDPREYLQALRATAEPPPGVPPQARLQKVLDAIHQFSGEGKEAWDAWGELWLKLRPAVDAAGRGQRVSDLEPGPPVKNHVNAIYRAAYAGKRKEVIRLLRQCVPGAAELRRAEEEQRLWLRGQGAAPLLGQVNRELRAWIGDVGVEILLPAETFQALKQACEATPVPDEQPLLDARVPPDGLEPPRWLWWRGERHEICGRRGRLLFDLLQYMWKRDVASFATLTDPERGRKKEREAEKELGRREIAKVFLRGVLAWGPRPASLVEALATEAGISAGTLKRAKKELMVVSVPASVANGKEWHWSLAPEAGAGP